MTTAPLRDRSVAPAPGTIDLEDGLIRVAEPLERSRARATLVTGSISTGHPARDRAVRSKPPAGHRGAPPHHLHR